MQTLADIQSNMRNDRLNGDVSTPETQDEFYHRLQEMHPDNDDKLPRSPFIRIKKTGVIWPWNEDFADRPDLCECCNEDGSPWVDTHTPPKQQPVQVNGVIERKAVNNEHASPVGMASETLGVDKEFSQDFSRANGSKEALPLPEQSTSVSIGSILDAVFSQNVK